MPFYEQVRWEAVIDSGYASLRQISEEHAEHTLREGGWTRKEILGHLIDSALNNHQRFVRAALDGSYEGPTYAQNGWVNIHGYGSMTWTNLVEHWGMQNRLLGEVVRRISEDRLEARCRIGTDETVTLRFLIEDYLQHLELHLRQIVNAT